jgi:hypothetical protein
MLLCRKTLNSAFRNKNFESNLKEAADNDGGKIWSREKKTEEVRS